MVSSSNIPYPPPVCSSADVTWNPFQTFRLSSRKKVLVQETLYGSDVEDDEDGFEGSAERNNKPAAGSLDSLLRDSLQVRKTNTPVQGLVQMSTTSSSFSVCSPRPKFKRATTTKAAANKVTTGSSAPAKEEIVTTTKLSKPSAKDLKGKRKASPDSGQPEFQMPVKIPRTTSSSPRPGSGRRTPKNLSNSAFTPLEYVDPRSTMKQSPVPAAVPASSACPRHQSPASNIHLPQVQRTQTTVGPAYVEPMRVGPTPFPTPPIAHSRHQQEDMNMPNISKQSKRKRNEDPELSASPIPSKVARRTPSSTQRLILRDTTDAIGVPTTDCLTPRLPLVTSGSHWATAAEASALSTVTHAGSPIRMPNITQVQRAQATEYPAHVSLPLKAPHMLLLSPDMAQPVIHGSKHTRALPQRVQQLNPTSTSRPISHAARTVQGVSQQVSVPPVFYSQSRFTNTHGQVLEEQTGSQSSQAPILYELPAVDLSEARYRDWQQAKAKFQEEVSERYSDEAAYYQKAYSQYDVNSPTSNYITTVPEVPSDLWHPPPLRDKKYYPFNVSKDSTLSHAINMPSNEGTT